ncbi:MAG: 4-hydroxy-tetrahydrodipicolinate synthase [Ruminococcaceae bacterium]|nr:4-hydroxy-tetrahydrodipicolinate synthase [Oscillospiraceae bacterium]
MSLHKTTLFTGVATALITPFANDKIDFDSLECLIERQIDAKVDALLVAGTTGESATLTFQELFDLTAFAKQRIRGRVPLLAGCGSNSTAHAIRLAEVAAEAGADGLLAVTPYYNKASDQGLLLHYRALADAAKRPLILYNVPSRTGYHLTMPLYRQLAVHQNIVGVKEASGDLGLFEALCDECGDNLDVYTGNDHQLVASVKLGGKGVISVCSNVIPAETAALYRFCACGDWRSAGREKRALYGRMQALFWEVNPIPVKYVAAQMGLCRLEYRLPLCEPSPETANRLREIFDL